MFYCTYVAPNPVDFDTIEVLITNASYVKITWKVRVYICVIYYAMQNVL